MQDRHTSRQLQIGHVERRTELHTSEVDFQELWQIFWQAADIEVRHHMTDDAGTEFDRRRNVGIDEMQRNPNVNFFVRIDALEIRM